MGLIKEPKSIDLSMMSKPWSEEELSEFRLIMEDLKSKKQKRKGLKTKK
jgi:hypothetical protein